MGLINTLKNRKRTRISSFFFNIALIFLALLILALGIYSLIKTIVINNTYVLTEGRITSIYEDEGFEMFEIKFPFDGEEHVAAIRSFDSEKMEGDLVKIYVNPNDCSEIRYQIKDNYVSSFALIGISLLVLALNLIFLIKALLLNKKISVITSKGTKVLAKIISVEEDDKDYTRVPKNVQVILEDGRTIQSENLYITYSILSYTNKYVNVYMVDDDVNQAYIDLDSISNESNGIIFDKGNKFDE